MTETIKHIFSLSAVILTLLAHPITASSQTKRTQPSVLINSDNPEMRFVVVDKSGCSLSVYQNVQDTWQEISTYTCTTGKVPGDKFEEGDLKTPNGVYWLKDLWLKDELNSLYGSAAKLYGAGAMPTNYPNHIDKVFQKKTGYGIWLHGTENQEPIETQGCVSVSNADFTKIASEVQTPQAWIVIEEKVETISQEESLSQQAELDRFLSDWISAWESNDYERYSSYYSAEFDNGRRNLTSWLDYKKRIYKKSSEKRIRIEQVSAAKTKDYYKIYFLQEYRSNLTQDVGWKTLFVRREQGTLKIISETWEASESVETKLKTVDVRSETSANKM